MARKTKDQKNTLTLRIEGEIGYLSGYINGKQVRKQSRDIAGLDKLKATLEIGAVRQEAALADRHPLPDSWISLAQLRECEQALHLTRDSRHSLTDLVRAGLAQLGSGEIVEIGFAVRQYMDSLEQRGLAKLYRYGVGQRLKAYVATINSKLLGEIAPSGIEAFCLRPGVSGYTKVGDSIVLKAFFNFCVARKWIGASPFAIDLESLKKGAERSKKRPKVLSPAQCESLLKAACEFDGGNHVPHVILGLWGGIRRAEVARLRASDIEFTGTGATVKIQPDVSKTASYREVRIAENVTPLLKECVERGFIDENPLGDLNLSSWIHIRQNAGLITCRRDTYRHRLVTHGNWQDNIMRHSGLSYYYRKTGDIQETARQAGHSTDIAFKHYITLTRPEDAPKFYSIRASLTPASAESKVA